MTISGYEWMLLITAISISASLGVAGVGSALVARLKMLRTAKIYKIQPARFVPTTKAA